MEDTYLEQILLFATETSSKFSQKRQNSSNYTTTTTRQKQWPTKQVENNDSQLLVPHLPNKLSAGRSRVILSSKSQTRHKPTDDQDLPLT